MMWGKWDGGKLAQRVVTERVWRAAYLVIWWHYVALFYLRSDYPLFRSSSSLVSLFLLY